MVRVLREEDVLAWSKSSMFQYVSLIHCVGGSLVSGDGW